MTNELIGLLHQVCSLVEAGGAVGQSKPLRDAMDRSYSNDSAWYMATGLALSRLAADDRIRQSNVYPLVVHAQFALKSAEEESHQATKLPFYQLGQLVIYLLDARPKHWNFTVEPIPDDYDEKVLRILQMFRKQDSPALSELSVRLTPEQAAVFTEFAYRAASRARLATDIDWVRLGLFAMAIGGQRAADGNPRIAMLWHSAVACGCDPKGLFSLYATMRLGTSSTILRDFMRSPLTIEQVDIRERQPENGHYYEHVTPRPQPLSTTGNLEPAESVPGAASSPA
jgi:hypothetical protein